MKLSNLQRQSFSGILTRGSTLSEFYIHLLTNLGHVKFTRYDDEESKTLIIECIQ